MKLIKYFSAFIFAVSVLVNLFACGNNFSTVHFTAFNTDISVAVKGNLSEEQKETLENYLKNTEHEFSAEKDNSFVSTFNAAKENQPISANKDVLEVLKTAKEVNTLTANAFNPAVYPLVKLWRLSSDTFDADAESYTPPEPDSVNALKEHTDFSDIVIDEKQNTVSKTDEKIMIDLGGIVKGYAADHIYSLLKEWGFEFGYVNIGGSSLYILDAEYLTIRHPRDSAAQNGILKINGANIKNKPLSTSGDYERFYISDGVRYCHIISPLTGAPVQTGVASATVIGGSACFTDAVTTALCAMEKDALTDFIKQELYNYEVYVVYIKDGVKEIITNRREGADFTLYDSTFAVCEI